MNNTDGKTSSFLPVEELEKRKCFFIMNEMVSPELFENFGLYTKETGIKFCVEHADGFIIIRKIENQN